MFDFEEVMIWIVSSVLLGLLLSMKIVGHFLYIDPGQIWLMIAFSLVMLFIFILAVKLTGSYLDCKTKLRWLNFRRYWFEDRFKLKWPFPLWLFLPIVFFFITLGKFVWTAIINFDIEPRESRIKRRWYDIEEREVSKILLAGPIASLIFGIILRLIGLSNLAIYPVWLSFLSLIPIGMGFKIFNGSRVMSVFLFFLSLFMLFLIQTINIFAVIIFCVLIALFIVIGYYSMFEQG
jgi:hypothetical protein